MSRPWIALDTETTRWEDARFHTVPQFVAGGIVTSASPDCVTLYRDREEMRQAVFLAIAADNVIVGHNLAFDLLVLDLVPCEGWIVYDTMIGDLLLRLAADDCADDSPGPPIPRSLERLFGRELSGKGTTQLRFGDYLHAPLPAEFERYLREDVLATRYVYQQQLAHTLPGGDAEMLRQVRAALALTHVTMNGLAINRREVERQSAIFQAELARLQGMLKEHGLFRPEARGPRGGIKKAGFEVKKFRVYVEALAKARGVVLSETEGGKTAVGEAALAPLRDDPVIMLWLEAQDNIKMLGTFLSHWHVDSVHPRYSLMMRTGRTSCSDPNLQQVPSRGVRGGVKTVFIPPPGRVFFELDYAQLELCCLAQLTKGRMLKLINEGRDLHRELGAVYFRKPVESVTKEERQLMKCANFGLPGGMGATKFRTFIMSNGLPDPGEKAARDLINAWLEAYPEMEDWLAEDRSNDRRVSRVWSGRADGESEAFVTACWELAYHRLHGQRMPHHIYTNILKGVGNGEVEAWLVGREVEVLGGRRRYPVSYTEQRNTRFQGLAADLAKEALTRIVLEQSGICTVHAFVHDSVLISVPEGQNANAVAQTMLDAERHWLPDCRAGVEIAGPGQSWWEARTGPKIMKNEEVNRI